MTKLQMDPEAIQEEIRQHEHLHHIGGYFLFLLLMSF